MKEQKWFEFCGGSAFSALSLLVVWNVAPEHFKGIFSCILVLVLFELGARRLPAILRQFSYVVAGIASLIVIGEASPHFFKPAPNYVWSSYAGATVCLYSLSERAGKRQRLVQALASSIAVVFSLCTLWILLPGAAVAPAWAALALALFVSGLRRDLLHQRWQAYGVMVAGIVNAWGTGFHAAAWILVSACYVAQFLSPMETQRVPGRRLGLVDRYARVFWSLLGTISVTTLLWEQFPGGLLTTAWGVEGLTLLIAGFPLRERVLRLEGLAMLLVCILKLFLYDLRSLETAYRILSFVALGLILLGVSSIYTRFRKQVSRYL